jgi:hypothetical protein
MEINGLPEDKGRKENINSLILAEYKFRSRISRILVERMQDYEDEVWEQISFDFDTEKKSFKISKKTPEPLYSHILGMSHLLQ